MTPRRWIFGSIALVALAVAGYISLRPVAPEHRTRRIDPEAAKDLVDTMGGPKTVKRIDPESSKDLIDTMGKPKAKAGNAPEGERRVP